MSLNIMLETCHKSKEMILCQCNGGHEKRELKSKNIDNEPTLLEVRNVKKTILFERCSFSNFQTNS